MMPSLELFGEKEKRGRGEDDLDDGDKLPYLRADLRLSRTRPDRRKLGDPQIARYTYHLLALA